MVIRNTIIYLIFSVLIINLAACSSSSKIADDTTTQAMTAAKISNAVHAIAAAKNANKLAISENYEWRDTRKIIKKAEKALAGGNNAKAINFANQARRQAENAVKQKYSELKRLKHMLGTN